jgi:tol-pal system protein YbgF
VVPEAAPGVPNELVVDRHPRTRVARLNGAVAFVLLLTAATGCASVPRLPGERRDDQLAALEARVLELSQKAAVQEVELARLRQQLAQLEARVPGRTVTRAGTGSASTPATSSAPTSAPRVDGSAARANVPPPRAVPAPTLEESELPIEEPVPAPVAVPVAPPRATTPPRPAGAAPAAATAAPGTPGPARPAGEGEPVAREAQAVYDEAYTFYHQGKYPQAEARFEEFLAQSPRSELSDNAQYWIGAARYARGDFRGALAAFRRTVELFPNANKVPDALYKMGQALEELSEPGQALAIYEELVQRFPETAAATLAEERRAKLNR